MRQKSLIILKVLPKFFFAFLLTATSALADETTINTPLYKAQVIKYEVTTPPLPASCCLIKAKFKLQEFLGTKPFVTVHDGWNAPRPINQPETLIGQEVELEWGVLKESILQIIPGEIIYLFIEKDHKGLFQFVNITRDDPRPGDSSAKFEVKINDHAIQIHPRDRLDYTLTYKNAGGFILEDVRIELMLIPFIQPFHFSQNPEPFGDQTKPFIWRLQKVEPGEDGRINFSLIVPDELEYPFEVGGILSPPRIFLADVLVYQQDHLIAFSSDEDDFISKEATLFLEGGDKKPLTSQDLIWVIKVALLFGSGMILETFLLTRRNFNLPLFLGCILLLPVFFGAAFWESSNLGMSLVVTFFLFGLTIAIAFKKEILPKIDELTLFSMTILFWYLLLATFRGAPMMRNYFVAIALLPSLWIITNGFLIREIGYAERILWYIWHLILNMYFIIFFSIPVLQQSTLSGYHLIILGMNSLYYLTNLFYFSELIPLLHWQEGQTLGEHLKNWKENLRFVAERFSNRQLKLVVAIFLLLVQGGILTANLLQKFVPDFVILNFVFLTPQIISFSESLLKKKAEAFK